MIRFKIDIMKALKNKGVTSYTIKQTKVIGQSTLTKLSKGEVPAASSLSTICEILKCQPGDILEWVPDTEEV